jgi:hypothetical protein
MILNLVVLGSDLGRKIASLLCGVFHTVAVKAEITPRYNHPYSYPQQTNIRIKQPTNSKVDIGLLLKSW